MMLTSRYDNTYVIDFSYELHHHKWAQKKKWYKPNNFIIANFDDFKDNIPKADMLMAYLNLARTITPRSRLYIIGHCDSGQHALYDTSGNTCGHYVRIAELLNYLFKNNQALRLNNGFNNLTISLIACHSADGRKGYCDSLAALLQGFLQSYYGLWVNIVARRLLVVVLDNGYKAVVTRKNARRYLKLNAMQAPLKPNLLAEEESYLKRRLPGAKRFFMWNNDGSRQSVNAYAYRGDWDFKQSLLLELTFAIKESPELHTLINYVEKTPAWEIANKPNPMLLACVRSNTLCTDPSDSEQAAEAIQDYFDLYKSSMTEPLDARVL